jgi:hypothetical protein
MAIDGTYQIEMDTPMGKQGAKLTLKTSGGTLSGTLEDTFGKHEFGGGKVEGEQATWDLEIDSPMGKLQLDCTARVSGDSISGEVKVGSFGTSPFKGQRA